MPVIDFESQFEQIVLTQAAIRTSQMLKDWFSRKEAAAQEPDERRRMEKLAALDPDRGDSREKVSQNLFDAFKADHASIFKYASRYNKRREDRVFQIDQLMPHEEANLKKMFDAFVDECYEADGRRKPMSVDQAAAAMHRFYETLKASIKPDSPHPVPLRYKRFPASFILTQLGSGEKWKDINGGQGIDFNRGGKPAAGAALDERFRQAFDGSRDAAREREFKSSDFIHHYESYVEIAGYRFPCLRFGWGQTYLLTDTGYCVDLKEDLVRTLASRLKQQKGGRVASVTIDFTPPAGKPDDPSTRHLSELVNTVFHPDVQTQTQEEWAEKARKSLEKLKRKLTRMKTAGTIDGRDAATGKAVLVSMDIDLLTGLSLKDTLNPDGSVKKKSEVTRLSDFINKHASEIRGSAPPDLVPMSGFLPLFPKPSEAGDYENVVKKKLSKLRRIAEREGNADMMDLIDAAGLQICTVAPRIMRAVDKDFVHKVTKGDKEVEEPIKTQAQLLKAADNDEDRKRHKKPRYFMTIGGIAAGKSNAEVIADEECGKGNYVLAGLDHVRARFDRQMINLATDNHNFDYKDIEQAGKLVRAIVLERARAQGYHVLLDGSGIPYEGRYDKILSAFKHDEKAYKTNVIAFDRSLYINDPALREKLSREHKAPKDALLQQGIRTGRDLRAVPVKIIANNYASVPEALLQASQDLNADRFWLIDTNPKKIKSPEGGVPNQGGGDDDMRPYILSFTAEITPEQLDRLDRLKGEGLQHAVAVLSQDSASEPRNKKIDKALNHPLYKPDATQAQHWDFKVVNKTPEGNYRIEIITDSQRYLSTMEKGLFNRDANGPEALFKLTKQMGFDVEGLFQTQNGTLRMQPEREISVEEWPQIPFATPHSLAARHERCLRIPDHPAVTFESIQPPHTGSAKAS